MRLSLLEPRWLLHPADGRRIGFAFRSPINLRFFLSVFFEPTPTEVQDETFATHIPETKNVLHANPSCAWSCLPALVDATFEDISVSPSVDAGNLWHGFIRAGTLEGGLPAS